MRQYPQRGDLVHVVEGGTFLVPQKPAGWKITRIIHGANVVVTGAEWDNIHPEFNEHKPPVWINGGRWIAADSWVPVYGPPVKEVVLGEQ